MNKQNIDLNKSFDKFSQTFRNPMLVHKIQDKLSTLRYASLFADSIRLMAQTSIGSVIDMISDQYKTNPQAILDIVGQETIDLINEFKNQ